MHEYIIDGGLEPGTPLPSESEMVEQIGVSKFSMREALRVAQSQGLIEISQGKRTRVADVSVKPAAGAMDLLLKRSKSLLLELTEARRSLEVSIVRLAAVNRTEAQVLEMEETIETMEANQGDISLCVDMDIEFHKIMARSTNNRVFELLHGSVVGLLRESREETMRISGIERPISEHRKIVEAIKAKDADKAAEYMQAHLDTAESSLNELS